MLGVVPGMVITELWDKMGMAKEQQKENFEKTASKLPVGFVGTPEDVSIREGKSCARWWLTLADCGSVFVLCEGGLC